MVAKGATPTMLASGAGALRWGGGTGEVVVGRGGDGGHRRRRGAGRTAASGAAPIWIGMRGRDEGGSGGEWEGGIGLGFGAQGVIGQGREWAGLAGHWLGRGPASLGGFFLFLFYFPPCLFCLFLFI